MLSCAHGLRSGRSHLASAASAVVCAEAACCRRERQMCGGGVANAAASRAIDGASNRRSGALGKPIAVGSPTGRDQKTAA